MHRAGLHFDQKLTKDNRDQTGEFPTLNVRMYKIRKMFCGLSSANSSNYYQYLIYKPMQLIMTEYSETESLLRL